jgi:hypothetical protein
MHKVLESDSQTNRYDQARHSKIQCTLLLLLVTVVQSFYACVVASIESVMLVKQIDA